MTDDTQEARLPATGFVRLPTILKLIPVSRSSWWAGVRSGRFPEPVKISPRVSKKNKFLDQYLSDDKGWTTVPITTTGTVTKPKLTIDLKAVRKDAEKKLKEKVKEKLLEKLFKKDKLKENSAHKSGKDLLKDTLKNLFK